MTDPKQAAEIEKRFTYHAPSEEQVPIYNALRQKGKEMAQMIQGLCPSSREQSLALTKLEETCFWANAAVARRWQPATPERTNADTPIPGAGADTE